MAEELGTKDVLEQVDTRLSTLEQDIRSLDAKVDARFDQESARVSARFDRVDERFDRVDARFDRVDARFDRMHQELTGLGDKLRSEMSTHGRWQIGIMLTLFLTVIASIWLNP